MEKESLYHFVMRKFKDKYDKGGNPYITHLLSVQKRFMDRYGGMDCDFLVACVLHDILEDTETTEEELLEVECVNERVVELVKILTRRKDETYMEYIRRVAVVEAARWIKICDLEDNMDITRLSSFSVEDFSLLKRYWEAWNFLNGRYIKNEESKL
jgi:(p)ppGpp synthase/HD superfamily hydrolase